MKFKDINEAPKFNAKKIAADIAGNIDINQAVYEATKSYFGGHELPNSEMSLLYKEINKALIKQLKSNG